MVLPDESHLPLADAQAIIAGYRKSTVHIYDGANTGPHDDIRAADLTSLAALNAFGGAEPSAVVGNLWDVRAEIEPLVALITQSPLVQLTPAEREQTACALDEVLTRIQNVHLWGGQGVAATKLVHRLRPNVTPIWDKFAGAAWYPPTISWSDWVRQTYRRVLSPENAAELEQLRSQDSVAAFGAPLPLLRVWDIILWWQGRD